MNAITIKQVQTFLAILQAGSFRAGSEKLHLSQPAVTAHIKQLELALGMPLLDRTTRRLSVTVAGERFRATIGRPDQGVRGICVGPRAMATSLRPPGCAGGFFWLASV
jgi:Bacterial regulatory helix-turn-helix protein, lysR family